MTQNRCLPFEVRRGGDSAGSKPPVEVGTEVGDLFPSLEIHDFSPLLHTCPGSGLILRKSFSCRATKRSAPGKTVWAEDLVADPSVSVTLLEHRTCSLPWTVDSEDVRG